jgi:hypothetical protein
VLVMNGKCSRLHIANLSSDSFVSRERNEKAHGWFGHGLERLAENFV